jgi:hypothetical protein
MGASGHWFLHRYNSVMSSASANPSTSSSTYLYFSDDDLSALGVSESELSFHRYGSYSIVTNHDTTVAGVLRDYTPMLTSSEQVGNAVDSIAAAKGYLKTPPDYSTNNVTLVESIEATIPGNIYWVTTDGGRTLNAYPRVNGSTNTAASATFQRGNVWLEFDNGKVSAFTDEEGSND